MKRDILGAFLMVSLIGCGRSPSVSDASPPEVKQEFTPKPAEHTGTSTEGMPGFTNKGHGYGLAPVPTPLDGSAVRMEFTPHPGTPMKESVASDAGRGPSTGLRDISNFN